MGCGFDSHRRLRIEIEPVGSVSLSFRTGEGRILSRTRKGSKGSKPGGAPRTGGQSTGNSPAQTSAGGQSRGRSNGSGGAPSAPQSEAVAPGEGDLQELSK